jgi:hypothetical protein
MNACTIGSNRAHIIEQVRDGPNAVGHGGTAAPLSPTTPQIMSSERTAVKYVPAQDLWDEVYNQRQNEGQKAR